MMIQDQVNHMAWPVFNLSLCTYLCGLVGCLERKLVVGWCVVGIRKGSASVHVLKVGVLTLVRFWKQTPDAYILIETEKAQEGVTEA